MQISHSNSACFEEASGTEKDAMGGGYELGVSEQYAVWCNIFSFSLFVLSITNGLGMSHWEGLKRNQIFQYASMPLSSHPERRRMMAQENATDAWHMTQHHAQQQEKQP